MLAAFFVHRPVLCIVYTCGSYATSRRSVFHLQFQPTASVQLLHGLPVPRATQCGTLDQCYLGVKLSHASWSHHIPLLHGMLLQTSPKPCDAALLMLWSLILRLQRSLQTRQFISRVSDDRYMLGDKRLPYCLAGHPVGDSVYLAGKRQR